MLVSSNAYRREVYHIQRELLRERTRCKALEEELENPMNIHRWRKLEVGVGTRNFWSARWLSFFKIYATFTYVTWRKENLETLKHLLFVKCKTKNYNISVLVNAHFFCYISSPRHITGQRSQHVRDDPENPNTSEKTHTENGGGNLLTAII